MFDQSQLTSDQVCQEGVGYIGWSITERQTHNKLVAQSFALALAPE